MGEIELDIELPEQDVEDMFEFLNSLKGEFPEITSPRLPYRSGRSVLENDINRIPDTNQLQ